MDASPFDPRPVLGSQLNILENPLAQPHPMQRRTLKPFYKSMASFFTGLTKRYKAKSDSKTLAKMNADGAVTPAATTSVVHAEAAGDCSDKAIQMQKDTSGPKQEDIMADIKPAPAVASAINIITCAQDAEEAKNDDISLVASSIVVPDDEQYVIFEGMDKITWHEPAFQKSEQQIVREALLDTSTSLSQDSFSQDFFSQNSEFTFNNPKDSQKDEGEEKIEHCTNSNITLEETTIRAPSPNTDISDSRRVSDR